MLLPEIAGPGTVCAGARIDFSIGRKTTPMGKVGPMVGVDTVPLGGVTMSAA